jgi:hypothetical protein
VNLLNLLIANEISGMVAPARYMRDQKVMENLLSQNTQSGLECSPHNEIVLENPILTLNQFYV